MTQNNNRVIIWKQTKPIKLENKSPCTDPCFLIPKQTTAEERKKKLSPQIVRKFTSHALQWKWIFVWQRSYLTFPGA